VRIIADEEWASHVLKVLNSVWDSGPDLTIQYGDKGDANGIVILKGRGCKKELSFMEERVPIYHADLKTKMPGEVIATYDDGGTAASYVKESRRIYLNADIIKTSHLLLALQKDAPLLGQNSPEKPLINDYVDLLKRLAEKYLDTELDESAEGLWPDGAPYAVCLTHDVDNVYKWWLKKSLSFIFKRRAMSDFFGSVGKGEYWRFDDIMDLESKYGFNSTFFFLTIKKDAQPRYDVRKLGEVIKRLDAGGWEVGLHTSMGAYNDLDRLRGEKSRLEKVLGKNVVGVRNHYLAFDANRTWKFQEEVGLKYDTTIGFGDTVGFKAGICHPYVPYCPMEDRAIKILELPMTVMDGPFMEFKDPMVKFEKILSTVNQHKGLLVIDWHQSSFDEKDYSKRIETYKMMLDRFKSDKAFVATCKDVADWWVDKSSKNDNSNFRWCRND